jgi:S1-C subfamily serine protease
MALTTSSCPKCGKPVLWSGSAAGGRVPCPHCKVLLEGGPQGIRVATIRTAPRPEPKERTAAPVSPPLPQPSVQRASVSPLAILAVSLAAVACVVASAFVARRWLQGDRPPDWEIGYGAVRDGLRQPAGRSQERDPEPLRPRDDGRGSDRRPASDTAPDAASGTDGDGRRGGDRTGGAGGPRRDDPQRPQAGLSAAVEAVRQSVVTIITGEGDTATGQGSGFVVVKRSWVATNLHVVADATRAVAFRKRDDGDVVHVEVAGFVACNPRADLVLLALKRDWPDEPLRLAAGAPKLGEDVFAIGSPKGLTETVTKGIVSAVREAADIGQGRLAPATKILQTDAFVTHGNSGGPLCAAGGSVLGINTFVLKDDDSQSVEFHFAVSVDELHKLIRSADSRIRPLSALPRGRR